MHRHEDSANIIDKLGKYPDTKKHLGYKLEKYAKQGNRNTILDLLDHFRNIIDTSHILKAAKNA